MSNIKQKTDLSAFMKVAPVMKVTISGSEIYIRLVFTISCCEIMFEQYEQSADYRSAFINAVYHMYQKTNNNRSIDLTVDDFDKISDETLLLILENILDQDSKVKTEYERVNSKLPYERFYNANKIVLVEATKNVSDSFIKMSNMFETLNKPLLTSINSAMSSIIVPTIDFHRMTIAIDNIPKFDFPQLQLAISSLPKINYPEIASVLANIPKPVFNIQEIAAPLLSMMESTRIVNENLMKTFQIPLLQMTENIQSLFSTIDFSLLIYRKEWSEQRETLLKYGWFYSDEFPEELMYEIHEKRESFTTDDVDKIIVTYFRKDRCKALKQVVKQWSELSYFNNREIIFHEALVNHSRKYYNSSITLLTIHTEGVITDFVRLNMQEPRFRVKKAIDDIKRVLGENETVSIYEYEVFNDVIEKIEDAFTEGFSHADPDKSSNKSRDKIAHGHAYEKENEVNSLKKLLYLNEIYHLFLLLKEQT